MINDPEVKQSSLSPPQSEQTNEPDALFIIEKAEPRTKAEVGVENTETFQEQRAGMPFSSRSRYSARQHEAHAKCNTSGIKDCCSAYIQGNMSRCGRQFLRSNSGIKAIVAYLDQRWAGMLAVRAGGKDYILIVRHYIVMATRETERDTTVPCNNPSWC